MIQDFDSLFDDDFEEHTENAEETESESNDWCDDICDEVEPEKSGSIFKFIKSIPYYFMLGLDHIVSYMARFMPFARRPLQYVIRFIRYYDEEPFDNLTFNGMTGCEYLNCPSCNYDMGSIYDDADSPWCDEKTAKLIKIGHAHPEFSLDAFNAMSWTVECTCPICKTKFEFEDSNY